LCAALLSTTRSGRGGRRFKSCHSDHLRHQGADKSHLIANTDQLDTRRVHKPVHRCVLRMVSLRRDSNGNFIARKRLDKLLTEERSAFTVRNTWLRAANTVYAWAAKRKLLTTSPFANAAVDVPKRKQRRPKWFYEHERTTILRAANAISDTSNPDDAARRWVPWLLAYTGASGRDNAATRHRRGTRRRCLDTESHARGRRNQRKGSPSRAGTCASCRTRLRRVRAKTW
jgi:hypothetical protein